MQAERMLERHPKFARIWAAIGILGVVATASWSLASSQAGAQSQPLDFLITGGILVDGTGAEARSADLGIRGDRIEFIGDAAKAKVRAKTEVHVPGLIVAPGFIDPHTHSLDYLNNAAHPGEYHPDRQNLNYLMQGVTTVVTGNDGGGPVNIAATLDKLQQQGIGTNVTLLVGFGTVRQQILGRADVAPTPEQLDKMRALVRSAMQEGAFGLSSGLFYVPQNYAKTEEVIELAKIAGEFGGYYDTHMRDEDSYSIGLLGSIDETLRIGREGHLPAHISHIKALGPAVWGKSADAIERVNAARAAGQSVTADEYPYTGSGSSLPASLLPPWAQEGNRDQIAARLNDPAQRDKILDGIRANLERRGGADALLFPSERMTELFGKTLAQVAAARNTPAAETALAIFQESLKNNTWGELGVISFNMSPADVERFMQQPWLMTGSDGSPGHPRLFGTFPRKFHDYVFEKKLISLPFAVRSSSALAAEMLGLKDRGLLKEGFAADVIALDPGDFADRATYEHPQVLASGVRLVFVNGVLTVKDGTYTGALAGKALRHKPPN
ncbi:MAG TPA: amidohydrolase family protein [Candidatus Acidoferrales bacterium]|nr:amidohydrolase family protein [Candidatus Acidoferrales bacterium]